MFWGRKPIKPCLKGKGAISANAKIIWGHVNPVIAYTILISVFVSVRSRTIGELLAPAAPFDKKCGGENWTVAFAPDGSYFAWSQGYRIVKLVPWSQCRKNL